MDDLPSARLLDSAGGRPLACLCPGALTSPSEWDVGFASSHTAARLSGHFLGRCEAVAGPGCLGQVPP